MPYTHGWWCNSRTFRMICRYCGNEVYYFSCNCGCKVFFDDLGPPWPRHMCPEYLAFQYGFKVKEVIIEDDYADEVQAQARVKIPALLDAIRQDPQDGLEANSEGIIQDIFYEVDLFKRFNIPQNSAVGISLLGQLGKEKYGQLTVHTGPLGEKERHSFTFHVKSEWLKRKDIIKGDFVTFHLRGITILTKTIWVCEELKGFFD